MMRFVLCPLVVVLPLSLVVGCNSTDSATPDQHVAEIRALNATWEKAAARRDLDGMMAIYAADAQELLPNRPPIVGRDSIRAFYRGLIEEVPRFAHQFDAHEIIVAESADLAVTRGSYRFTADTLRHADVRTGTFVGVWRRRDGEWRLQMNISNSDQPLSESP